MSTYCLYENLEGLESMKSKYRIARYKLIVQDGEMLAAGRNFEMGNLFIIVCALK